jgi:hypothetical protein
LIEQKIKLRDLTIFSSKKNFLLQEEALSCNKGFLITSFVLMQKDQNEQRREIGSIVIQAI